ncbi:ATP-binding protein [Nonomuraea rhodomycinica]|uniref:Tetratricopeptide repeat protein n=1 Tax=Nonomuraea rhodomycinica TaxID=1712872 RepID=A0A7Y6IYH4_9ACTN|nr:BTAD domain-containing putative transcriptional regulator [Nonomuraea rhodomycinica]NUW46751.1 tetratricopeptide repeat protein [Nonomuraea rhodomycinica]
MRFEILGPARVVGEDGEPIPLGGPRVRALLALLALDAGRVVGAGSLIDGLYGERPPEGVANALQSQVSRLRRALGRELVEFHPAGYLLAADPEDVDARRFTRLAAEGRTALAAGDPLRAAGLLHEALGLWRGAPLADVPHAEPVVAGLEELRLAAVEDRVQADLELGRHREVVAELRRLTAAHPLRERPHAQLMRALYGSGRQAEALTAYERARRALAEELGIDPGTELSATHLAVLRGDPSLSPSPGGGAQRPGMARTAGRAAPGPPDGGGRLGRRGLRAQLTSFVGRTEELRQVGAYLREARLVTLVGAGGAGKTRLALEAVGRTDGDVCLVQLAPLAAGGDVAKAVLAALGVRDPLLSGPERPNADPAARLVAALAGRDLLLVLDNCEHVVEAAAELADALLAACPALRVLATSREALGITGERVLPVAPLDLPPPGAADLLGSAAVRLFADRAAAVRPGFTVDEGNGAAVAGVCRALDGLPLAIELAAARLRTMSLEDLAARLDDRFRLLAKGSRTALPRHQTLRGVVAWSWDLLDEDEQRLARRMAVFAGGATPEAAERVCGVPEETLFALADKSLVEVVDGRYRMLQTIRAFCAERLAEAGEVARVREAHAAYYLELALTADRHVRRAEQLVWLARLDEESGDLDAAVRWAAESGHAELGLRLLAAAACYWWLRGHRLACAELAQAVLATVPDQAPEGLEEEYAMCVLVAAWGHEPGAALRERLAGLRRLLPLGYLPSRVEFLTMVLPMFAGPPDTAEWASELVTGAEASMTPWSRALSQYGVALVEQLAGRAGVAKAGFTQALASFRQLGERWGIALVLTGLGDLAFREGDYVSAYELAGQALKTARELGALPDMAESLCRRADAAARLGDPEEARAGYERADELARRAASSEMTALAQAGLGELALERGDLAEARARLEQGLAECPEGWYSAEDVRDRLLAGLEELRRLEEGAPRRAPR